MARTPSEIQRDRQAKGLCVSCGSLARPDRVHCQACADKTAAKSRERFKRRKEAGVCGQCGVRPARPDRTTCATCSATMTDTARRNKAKKTGICCVCHKLEIETPDMTCRDCHATWKAQQSEHAAAYEEARFIAKEERAVVNQARGMCVRCGDRPPDAGRRTCTYCFEFLKDPKRSTRELRVAAGMCVNCGKSSERGKLCYACKSTTQRQRCARTVRGLCTHCPNPVENGRKRCTDCRAKARQRNKAWAAAGLCRHCGDTVAEGYRFCAPCRAKSTEKQKRLWARLRESVYAAYGGPVCRCCGETEVLFLTVDHINNNGAEHRRQLYGKNNSVSNRRFYVWLRQNGYPEGLQILCYNCNVGKHRNGGVCPHQTPKSGPMICAAPEQGKQSHACGTKPLIPMEPKG